MTAESVASPSTSRRTCATPSAWLPVGRGRRGEPMDHRHRLQTVKPYAYEDAATLLADFWQAVDAVLKERGVL